MNGLVGQIGVWLGFVAALSGASLLALSLGRRARGHPIDRRIDGRLCAPLLVLGMVVAVVAMEHALVTHDFSLAFVADNNSRATPLIYSITGLWSALAGSILLWGLALSMFTGVLVWRYRASDDPVVAWAALVMFCVSAFFIGLMVGPANPFLHVVGRAPAQGAGPNALLQDNPLVAIHPPLLYLGFVGFTVPFAFAVGMLATGRVGDRWQIETRRWTLAVWTFLSVGIVLGAWWSYQVLGWGGFWGWDPVENAALLPWLCGTAYLHSVLVQERRGLLRVWNLSLSVATFALTILATFLTRSGVIVSVHAFSDSTLGPILIGFFLLVVAVGFGLIAWRGDRLRSPGGIDAPLGREGAFLLNNLLFVGFAFVVLLGTLFPLLYQALKNQAVTIGAPYFNTVAVPVGLALLALMALAPTLSWRKIDAGVLWRRIAIPAWAGVLVIAVCVIAGLRGVAPLLAFGLGTIAASSALRSIVLSVRAGRRQGHGALQSFRTRANGGMVVHLGVVVLAIGLTAATSYAQRTELSLRPGQTRSFDGHTLRFERLATVISPSRKATEALIQVDGAGTFRPAVTQFAGSNSQAVGTPAIDSGFAGDVYLTFDSLGGSGGATGGQVIANLAPGSIALGVTVEPLIDWMWAGGLLIGLGGLLAIFPGRRRRATDPVSGRAVADPVAAPAEASPAGAGAGDDAGVERTSVGVGDGASVKAAVPPRRRHTARWVAGGLLVVLIVVSVVLATRPTQQATVVASPLDGAPAPPISATTFAGRHISLASLRGRYVFVNFFASWCPPCQTEEPTLVAFNFEQHRVTNGAALLSVDIDDSASDGKQFVEQWGATWPAVPDHAGTIANAYGVGSPPMTFLIDPRGTVVTAYAGPVRLSQLQAMLASAKRHA